MTIRRRLFTWADAEDADRAAYQGRSDRDPCFDIRDADLVSSELENGQHAPALDIDLPVRVVQSRTKGHHHLYIDKPMSWDDYKKVLNVLAEVGIIQSGYCSASIDRQGSHLRVRPDSPLEVNALTDAF